MRRATKFLLGSGAEMWMVDGMQGFWGGGEDIGQMIGTVPRL